MMSDAETRTGLGPPQCDSCDTRQSLTPCDGCKAVLFCKRHARDAYGPHSTRCSEIQRLVKHVQEKREEYILGERCGLFGGPRNAFERGGTATDYMRARLILVEELLRLDSFTAVDCALEHLMDMLRQDRRDNMSLRAMVPALFVRLGRDQECYDFMKWRPIPSSEDTELLYLDIRGANMLESPDAFCGGSAELTDTVPLTLLKIRLLLGIQAKEAATATISTSTTSSPNTSTSPVLSTTQSTNPVVPRFHLQLHGMEEVTLSIEPGVPRLLLEIQAIEAATTGTDPAAPRLVLRIQGTEGVTHSNGQVQQETLHRVPVAPIQSAADPSSKTSEAGGPVEVETPDFPDSDAVPLSLVSQSDPSPAITTLREQIKKLFETVHKKNRFFWGMLLNAPQLPTINRDSAYLTAGSVNEAILVMKDNYSSWVETPGAIAVIDKLMG